MKLNFPNILTLSRLLGIPAFLIWGSRDFFAGMILAVLLLTDFLDGWTARRLNQESDFGALLDPVVDRAVALILYSYLAYYSSGIWPWLYFIVSFRHFSQLSAVPILLTLKIEFYARPKSFPKWVTAFNSIFVFIPLFLDLSELVQLPILLSMIFCEILILMKFWPRFIQILRGQHNTFE